MARTDESSACEAKKYHPNLTRARGLALIVLAGFFLAVCYIYVQGVYRGKSYPLNTFLFLPSIRFTDFYQVVREGASLEPYLKHKSAQYPFLVIVAYLFSRLPSPYSYWVYVAIWGSAFVALTFGFLRGGPWYERAIITFALIFLSYPFLFTLDRGNFEGLVFVLVLAFGYFFAKRHYLLAAALLAMAAAMKLLPLFLTILFIRERKFRVFALCIGMTAILMLISLKAFRGGGWVNLEYILHGSNLLANTAFASFTSLGSGLVQRGVSLLTLLKIAHFEWGWFAWSTGPHFMVVYLLVGAGLGILVSLYVVFIEKVLWKRVAALVFAMLLLPTISADYRLLYVFLPALLFIGSSESASKLDSLYLLFFGLLLIPKGYYYFQSFRSDSMTHDITISVVINILDMIAFSLIIMVSGARKWFLDLGARAQAAPPEGQQLAERAEKESGI